MLNISLVYGYVLILNGLLISLYVNLEQLSNPVNVRINNINSIRWGQLSLFPFLILTFMGTCIIYIDIGWKDIIYHAFVENPLGKIFGIAFIGHISIAFMVILRSMKMSVEPGRSGFLALEINRLQFILLSIFFPTTKYGSTGITLSFIWIFFYIFLGVPTLLIVLTILPIVYTKYVFEKTRAS